MEPGEFAVRGGLVDLFPPGTTEPLRLDLFGDVLEAIRSFDPMSQRSTGTRDEVVLLPVSEVLLTTDSIARFRGGYRELFGNVAGDDALYEAVSAGQRHVGMEHWLPLFHERLETLLDYCPEAVVTADHQIAEAFEARHELITDYYDARLKTGAKGGMSGAADYKPVPPERLYLKPSEWDRLLEGHAVGQFTSFDAAPDAPNTIDLGGRRHEGFAQARTAQGVNLFDEVAEHVKAANAAGRRVAGRGLHRRLGEPPAAPAAGARRHDAGARCPTSPRCRACRPARSASPSGRSSTASCWMAWKSSAKRTSSAIACRGRPRSAGRRSASSPRRRRSSEGDLVVHREHGVGRYEGLVTLEIQNARHDCLQADLRRRRQALRAGREHRRAEPLRLGGGGRRARPAGRRRLAVAQGPAEAAHRRHGRPADQDRRRARHPPRRDDEPARRRSTRSSAPASPMPRPTTSCRPSPTCWTTCRPASRWTG